MNRIVVYSILFVGCELFLSCQKYFGEKIIVKYIEIFVFLIYLYGLLYFTFLLRETGNNTLITFQPLRSYRRAFAFDSGFLHVLKQIFTGGLIEGLDSIHIESTETLDGIILNILRFVPFWVHAPLPFEKDRKSTRLNSSHQD